MFHLSVIAPNATMVIYGILFGGTLPYHFIVIILIAFIIIILYINTCDIFRYISISRKEDNVLFNDVFNTYYL